MAVSAENEYRAKRTIERLSDSELPTVEKDEYIDMITLSKEATNGYTSEEKIQKISENQFHMIRRMADEKIESSKLRKEIICGMNDLKNDRDKMLAEIESVRALLDSKIADVKTDITEMKQFMASYDKKMEKVLQMFIDANSRNASAAEQTSTSGNPIGTDDDVWYKKIASYIYEARWTIFAIFAVMCFTISYKPELQEFFKALFHVE